MSNPFEAGKRWGEQHGPLSAVLALLIYLLLGGVALLWAWNTVGHDLFGGPQARFVHAFALLVGIVLLALPFKAHRGIPWISRRHRR
jgi:hypothetical protein